MSGHDDLVARARERAEGSPIPADWGHRIALDENEEFVGRWRGETVDEQNVDDRGDPRRIFLLWDEDRQQCFSRFYAALGREIDRVKPGIGDVIAIFRGADYPTAKGSGYSFGVETAPSDEPLPEAEDNELEPAEDMPF